MLKKSFLNILLIIIYSSSCLFIYQSKDLNYKQEKEKIEDDKIGYLEIKKINFQKPLYKGKKNNIEENVTIIKNEHNLLVLAAHSGTGPKALFNDLYQLNKGDKITINLNNELTNYQIEKIEEQKKDGTIEINKTNNKKLILTTCSLKSSYKQLVITCKLIT